MGTSHKRLLGAAVMVVASSAFGAGADQNADANCATPMLGCASTIANDSGNFFADLLTTPSLADANSASATPESTATPWSFSIKPALGGDTQTTEDDVAGHITNALATAMHQHGDQLPDGINITHAVSGADALMRAMSETRNNTQLAAQGTTLNTAQQGANLASNLLRAASTIRINATMPVADSASLQRSEQQLQDAMNSEAVSDYLSQHADIVQLLAKMLGWESTGLQPTAADVQKMASAHLTAVANSVESWALNNVSFSSHTLALTDNDSYDGNVQWQWAINNNRLASNGDDGSAYGGSSFGSSLRAMFGMSDY